MMISIRFSLLFVMSLFWPMPTQQGADTVHLTASESSVTKNKDLGNVTYRTFKTDLKIIHVNL